MGVGTWTTGVPVACWDMKNTGKAANSNLFLRKPQAVIIGQFLDGFAYKEPRLVGYSMSVSSKLKTG